VLDKKGFKIVRENGVATYYYNGQKGVEPTWDNSGYILHFRRPKELACSIKANVNTTTVLHDRLAHINPKFIKNSVKKGAISGIPLEQVEGDFHCQDCHTGKETRKPFPTSTTKKDILPGEIIHADLSGAINPNGLGGYKYFLLIKDECTGFKHVDFLKTKDETAEHVKSFITLIKNQTDANVKIFKSDNGTEFEEARNTSSDHSPLLPRVKRANRERNANSKGCC